MYARALLLCVLLALTSSGAAAQSVIVEDFSNDIPGKPPSTFSTPVGFWTVGTTDASGSKPSLFEDGTRWPGSGPANALADQARSLYGDRWAEFIDDLSETGYFPMAIFNAVPNFSSGTLTTRFMIVGGNVDQDFGILFNYQPNGDFMALRSDSEENNLLLYQWRQGQPSSLRRIRNVPTEFAQWHEQRVVVTGLHVAGYLDGRKYLDTDLDAPVSGGVGVWAKTDTVALVDRFSVEPAE